MRNILEQLARGDMPQEPNYHRNPEYTKAITTAAQYEQKLLALLNDDGKAILQEFIHAQMEVECLTNIENFTHGCKFGITVTAEALFL